MNATNLRALVEFYILKKEDRLSQTDRKGDKCMPVKILSFERDINTLTMGAGTHVIIGPESDHWECLSVTHSLTS